jgi:hypothetical protein
MEHRAHEEGKAFEVVKMALVASVRGYPPQVAVEFARKLLFSDIRPTFGDLENHLKGKPPGAASKRARRPKRSTTHGGRRSRPIIIKRKKVIAGGHHGGAWKVAYADFVTAMMAFFMVMWLVSTVSKEQRAAMFDYFKNPSMEQGKSPKPAPGQAGPGGASTSPINLRGGLDAPRTFSQTPDIGGRWRRSALPTSRRWTSPRRRSLPRPPRRSSSSH